MEASKNIGSASEFAHHVKLIKDYELGLLPKELEPEVNRIRNKISKLTSFEPHPVLQNAYSAFRELRSTKTYESPIAHTDMRAYEELYGIKLQIWEVKLILQLQGQWYKSHEKHHK